MGAEATAMVKNAGGRLVAAAALFLAAPAGAGQISFAQDVQPVLARHCVMCHLPGAAQGGHSLYPDAWASMVRVPSAQSALLLVEPGKPEASYSYLKLTGGHLAAGGSGEIMPFPNGPLAAEEIDAFRAWIEQGAGRD
ncbi:MAG TPA: hypothetical protein VFG48_09690 [Xanthomonadales bacterium]|nr:hypothetical protein [Xanthomonadales bacterium]